MQQADRWIFVLVSLLLCFGLVFSYSLPIFLEIKYGWSEYHFFSRFLFFTFLSLGIMFFLSQCNPDICIHKIGIFLFIVSLVLIILMATPLLTPICPTIKGARRWIKIFGLSFAPVEFFKIGITYFFAWSFSRKLLNRKFYSIKEELYIILPYIVILFTMFSVIVIFQSDLGQVMLISAIFLIMLLFTKVSFRLFIFLFGFLIIAGAFFIFQEDYRISRVETFIASIYLQLPEYIRDFFDIHFSSMDISYQLRQSMNAIHNGGFTGVGIGYGEMKMGFLSDIHTDFILSGIAEELGLIGVLIVISLYVLLVWRVLKIAYHIEDDVDNANVYRFFVVGMATLLIIEIVLNLLGIIGLCPLKGLPLPFLSYGGSSIVAFSISMGMILMISKRSDL